MLADRRIRREAGWFLLAGYAALLAILLPIRPLWLDELMEVVATAKLPLHDVVAGYAAHSAGQSPLGAVEQALAIRLLGYSTFAARLPAALASVLGAAGMLVLARQAGLRRRWMALLLFISFPLVLRYGAEARPYSQGLCVAVWLHVLFLRIEDEPNSLLLSAYGLLLLIGLYTQPYILFVAAAHTTVLAWRRRWPLVYAFLSVMIVAVCLYLPWYFHSRGFWREEVEASQLHFHLQAKLALLIPRELIGSGYVGTIFVAALSTFGLSYLSKRGTDRLFWILSILLPLALVILADLIFDYFFAIRQVILILPPLAITAAGGLEQLWAEKRNRVACIAAALLIAVNAGYAIRWFTKPGENWAAAAATLQQSVGSGCFLALPPGSIPYYEFFQPSLQSRECASPSLSSQTRVAVAVSPYLIDRNSEQDVERELTANHLHLTKQEAGQPQIRIYEK